MKSNLDYMSELFAFYQETADLLKKMPDECNYKTTSILNGYQQLFERFCPYQIGDKVLLTKAPDFEKAPGWIGSKHFLIPGAIGYIKTRDFRNNSFIFGIEFEDDSFIDHNGKIHKIKRAERYLFLLPESELAAAED
jgi:hypothetical protein